MKTVFSAESAKTLRRRPKRSNTSRYRRRETCGARQYEKGTWKKHLIGEKIINKNSTQYEIFNFTESQLCTSIERMPSGGALGTDSLQPCHKKQLICWKAADFGKRLLSELFCFVALCLQKSIPNMIRPLFFGANLLALKKKRRPQTNCSGACAKATYLTSGMRCL